MRIAIIGHGNIGHFVIRSVKNYPDMECIGWYRHDEIGSVLLSKPDCTLLCTPSRQTPDLVQQLLSRGICTVDSFDIHEKIVSVRSELMPIAVSHSAVAIIAAGWDPGSDSVVRAMMRAMLPQATLYTNFGPGRSMGHSVAVKAIPGVKDAVSITLPVGQGRHKRHVYVELEPNATLQQVTEAIKGDKYFVNDETEVEVVGSIKDVDTLRHGVLIEASWSGSDDGKQEIKFSMDITNPLLTAQVMLSAARATGHLRPGVYTMIEIPPICYLPDEDEKSIRDTV